MVHAPHVCTGKDGLPKKIPLTVRSGSESRTQGGKITKVSKVICHENYHYNKPDENLLAILVLDEKLKFDEKTKSVPLADKNPEIERSGEISGFGTLGLGRNYATKVLLNTKVRVKKCENLWNGDSVVCAGSRDRRISCFGDWGSPLVVNGVLAGIFVSGLGCVGGNDKMAVFASVAFYKNWIETTMMKEGSINDEDEKESSVGLVKKM